MHGEDQFQDGRWPNGKPGNRRTGKVKGTHSGRRRGQLPASKDPIILKRRQLAAPLWERGYSASQILERINVWLESEEHLPVSLTTIYKDHAAILKVWRRDFAATVQEARLTHIASLQRVKREAWAAYDLLKADEGPDEGDGSGRAPRVRRPRASAVGAQYLNTIRAIEETLAKIDGSSSPEKFQLVEASERIEAFERMVLDAIAEVSPDVRSAIEDKIRARLLGPPSQ